MALAELKICQSFMEKTACDCNTFQRYSITGRFSGSLSTIRLVTVYKSASDFFRLCRTGSQPTGITHPEADQNAQAQRPTPAIEQVMQAAHGRWAKGRQQIAHALRHTRQGRSLRRRGRTHTDQGQGNQENTTTTNTKQHRPQQRPRWQDQKADEGQPLQQGTRQGNGTLVMQTAEYRQEQQGRDGGRQLHQTVNLAGMSRFK